AVHARLGLARGRARARGLLRVQAVHADLMFAGGHRGPPFVSSSMDGGRRATLRDRSSSPVWIYTMRRGRVVRDARKSRPIATRVTTVGVMAIGWRSRAGWWVR